MVEIKWQDPPTIRQRPGAYDDVIAVLKQNPGKWALISEDWKTSAGPAAFKQQGCEATTRKNTDGKTWSVFARCPISKEHPARIPTATEVEKAKVQKAVQTGTALKPPAPAADRSPVPVSVGGAQARGGVRPANDFGMESFRAARAARGFPAEGKR
jgi:hypothetical protein